MNKVLAFKTPVKNKFNHEDSRIVDRIEKNTIAPKLLETLENVYLCFAINIERMEVYGINPDVMDVFAPIDEALMASDSGEIEFKVIECESEEDRFETHREARVVLKIVTDDKAQVLEIINSVIQEDGNCVGDYIVAEHGKFHVFETDRPTREERSYMREMMYLLWIMFGHEVMQGEKS